mmetsp:Transcript_51023/g.119342  ORF Transcript_51023/g.119342 Transcript_51023/m.119342 type:complete len:228 (-) Transcript_51023:63-746(-)
MMPLSSTCGIRRTRTFTSTPPVSSRNCFAPSCPRFPPSIGRFLDFLLPLSVPSSLIVPLRDIDALSPPSTFSSSFALSFNSQAEAVGAPTPNMLSMLGLRFCQPILGSALKAVTRLEDERCPFPEMREAATATADLFSLRTAPEDDGRNAGGRKASNAVPLRLRMLPWEAGRTAGCSCVGRSAVGASGDAIMPRRFCQGDATGFPSIAVGSPTLMAPRPPRLHGVCL